MCPQPLRPLAQETILRPARPLLLLAMLLVSSTQADAAAGVHIRWDHCLADAGVMDKAFACNTNTGTEKLFGGFQLGTDLAHVSGNEIVVDIASAGSTLPAWWQFKNPGTCRLSALTLVIAEIPDGPNCPNWDQDYASGSIGAYKIGIRGTTTARDVAVLAVPSEVLQDLFGGKDYYAFSLYISHTSSVGTGACGGCLTPVCIYLNSINVTTPFLADNRKLSGPSNGVDADFVTWQGGGGVVAGAVIGCPAATPTKQRTWGSMKALYR